MTGAVTPLLRIVQPNGSYGDPLFGWASMSLGGDDGEQLVLQFDYASNAQGYSQLQNGTQLALLLNGVEIPDGRFTIDQTSTDEVEVTGLAQFTANSTLFQLGYALVYAESWNVGGGPGNVSTPGWVFASQTPGQALRELLEAAQARGWWTSLTWDFTDTLDSSGAAWSANVDEFFDQGKTLLDVLKVLLEKQICVARMVGSTLKLYKYGNQGPDLSGSVMLMRDLDLNEGPVAKSTRDSISVLVAVTDTFGVEIVDAPAMSAFGRREGFISQQDVADPGTLTSIAQDTMVLKGRSRDNYTYGLQCAAGRPIPFVNYDRGTQVTLDVIGARRVMRVRQLTAAWDNDGVMSGSASFGDKIMEADEQLALRLEQLTRGSMDSGINRSPILGSFSGDGGGGGGGGTPDTLAPKAPSGLSATSAPYFEPPGSLFATVSLSWVAPTQNVDNSPLTDLAQYEVQHKASADSVWLSDGLWDRSDTTARIQRMLPTTQYDFRVRAVDQWSNVSAWSGTFQYTPSSDTTAPTTQPSAPTVAPFLYQGLLITWDGKAQGGGAVNNDTRHVEVHVSTSTGFTPGPTTLKDTIPVPGGSTVVAGLTAGTTYYVKFVIVDWAGNKGPTASSQTTGVPEAVDTNDIGAGQVQTGNIAALAVTDAKIGDLSATKITAGTLSAVVTLSGTIKTASSGQRVEMTANGIKMFDASNNVVVALDSGTGTAQFNGVLGTAQISGSVYVNGTAGSQVIITNLGGFPLTAYLTGRLIEKYPCYLFASTDSFLRYLTWQANSPGTYYTGFTSTPQFTSMKLDTIIQDGDFNNATTLPTILYGQARFSFPQSYVSGSLGNQAAIELRSHTANTAQNLQPGITIRNSDSSAPRVITLSLEQLAGGNYYNCALAVARGGGADNLYAPIRASSFDVNSGAATKTDVTDVPFSALDVIRANPARRWRHRDDDVVYIGPMADDLPNEIAVHDDPGHLIKGTSMNGLLWKACEELMARVAELEEAIAG